MLILIILIISFFLTAGINSTVPLFMGIIASLLILSAKLVGKKEDEELKDKYLPKKLPGKGTVPGKLFLQYTIEKIRKSRISIYDLMI